jgi:hypothetical protein
MGDEFIANLTGAECDQVIPATAGIARGLSYFPGAGCMRRMRGADPSASKRSIFAFSIRFFTSSAATSCDTSWPSLARLS